MENGHEIPGVDLILFYVFIFWCGGYIGKKGLKGTALSPWLWKVTRSWCCKVYGSSCNPSSSPNIYKLTQSQCWYTKEEMRSAKASRCQRGVLWGDLSTPGSHPLPCLIESPGQNMWTLRLLFLPKSLTDSLYKMNYWILILKWWIRYDCDHSKSSRALISLQT